MEFSSLLSWNHVTFSWSCCCWWLGRAGKEIDIYSGAETNKASSAPADLLTHSAVGTKTREALFERKLHKAFSSDLLSERWVRIFKAIFGKKRKLLLEAPTISFRQVVKLLPKSSKTPQLQWENLVFMFFSKGKNHLIKGNLLWGSSCLFGKNCI